MFSVSPIMIAPLPKKKEQKKTWAFIYSRLSELVYAMIGINSLISRSSNKPVHTPAGLSLQCLLSVDTFPMKIIKYSISLCYSHPVRLLPLLISYDIM